MGKINFGRVVVGGIVAGIVLDILGYLVDGLMLAPQWAAGMKALGRPEFSGGQIMGFNLIGLVYGILVVWLYAAIRPRYGPGRKRLSSQECWLGPSACFFPKLASWVCPVCFRQI